MPRTARITPGGMVFHVLNRGVGRMRLFKKDRDYEAFEEIVAKTLLSCPMRICSYCLMPNHWHFVLWPERDGDLAAFMQKLTVTHVRNWQEHRRREHGTAEDRRLLGGWPLPRSRRWREFVDEPQTEPEVKAIRHALERGQPYGSETWVGRTAKRLGLESTMRRRSRPKN